MVANPGDPWHVDAREPFLQPVRLPGVDPLAAVAARGGAVRVTDLPPLDEDALWSLVRAGRLVWRARKVLALPTASAGLVAAVGVAGTLVDESAAAEHGLQLLQRPGLVRVAVPRATSRRHMPGVQVLRRDLAPGDVGTGGHVLTPLASVISCAYRLPFEEALIVADSAAHLGLLTADSLLRAADRLRGLDPTPLRAIARLADPRCASLLETLQRLAAMDVGCAFELQVALPGVGEVDAVLEGWLVSEADGAEHHSDRADYRRDRERERAIVRLGMSYIRFGYEDLVHHPRRTRAEMRAALAAGPPRR